ncbi:uncharacterized protein LOC125178049 [Hyalella azteca]|uniref:Uncharacterized protein LOC125178049 n=1 Tax=Hyalella azteca TaxID=294128 RepID=A0A979FK27_HYAAZ|nr:uncharacterized protein LOC125178049 [Hyalella azteca]
MCSEISSTLFITVPVNITTVLNFPHSLVSTSKECSCAALAVSYSSLLYCFLGLECLLVTGQLNHVRGPQTGSWHCKTPAASYTDGCTLDNGTSISLYTTHQRFCPDDLICSPTGLIQGEYRTKEGEYRTNRGVHNFNA